MATLYEIYAQQGKPLPSTADARFADPAFASAAQKAGVQKDQYGVNPGNAELNTRIAANYAPTPAPSSSMPIQQTEEQRQAALRDGAVAKVAPSTPKNLAEVYGATLTDADKDFNNFVSEARKNATNPVDEEAIRANIQRQLQAETDALNRVYDEKLRVARIGGENNLGTTAAISARRGLLGSDFGNAQRSNIESRNAEVYSGIDAERAAAISALTTKGAALARDEIAQKNLLKSQSTTDYINYLSKQEERRTTRVKNIVGSALASGYDLVNMEDAELKAIADSAQISLDALKREFATQKESKDKATADAQSKATKEAREQQEADAKAERERYITLSDGVSLFDVKTQKVVSENPKNFAPKAIPRGAAPKSDPVTIKRAKDTAQRIVAGQGTLDELSPSVKIDVKNNLYELGYGQNVQAPTWFVEIIKERDGTVDAAVVSAEWNKENARIFKEAPPKSKKSSTGGSATVDDL